MRSYEKIGIHYREASAWVGLWWTRYGLWLGGYLLDQFLGLFQYADAVSL